MFDLLLKSQEPLSAQQIAQELDTSVDGAERLLDTLVGIEILEVETCDGTGASGSRQSRTCVTCVLNVTFCGESSPVQQHRCGQPLLGQRQRQVSPRHDRLPITDHLPALEQHHGRRQVGVCSCTFRDLLCSRSLGPRTMCRTCPHGSPSSVHAGRARTRTKRRLASQRGTSSRPFTGLCLLGGFSATCGLHHGLQSRFRSEEQTLKFMGLMNSTWVLDGHDIATAFNLSCFHNIVDLGGQIRNSLLLPQTMLRPLCVHVRVFC